jgi:hypothetical protein
MALTRKDVVATMLAVVIVLVAMAVLGGWDWPLLGTERAGAIAVLVLGMAVCTQGTAISEGSSMREPYVATMSLVGIAVLGTAIWAIVAGTETAFAVEVTVTLVMWLISTLRHALGVGPTPATR